MINLLAKPSKMILTKRTYQLCTEMYFGRNTRLAKIAKIHAIMIMKTARVLHVDASFYYSP